MWIESQNKTKKWYQNLQFRRVPTEYFSSRGSKLLLSSCPSNPSSTQIAAHHGAEEMKFSASRVIKFKYRKVMPAFSDWILNMMEG